MLGKAVLTLVVIIIAILVVKQRNNQESGKSQSAQRKQSKADNTMSSDLRFAAYMFLILMFGAGAFMYYQRWQDDHTVLTVNLYGDGQAGPASYEVYKYQLESRSFTTIEGVRITLADNERMEVTGLK